MGASRLQQVACVLTLLSVAYATLFEYDECLFGGHCKSSRKDKENTKSTITFMLPEICYPSSSGIMSAEPRNMTINTDRDCDPFQYESIYRTADGTCNHPFNLGASTKPLSRLLPARYEDGREVPRIHGKLGLPLPNARLVSKVIHPDIRTSTPFTVFVMQWGQLMDHDMVSTPLPVDDTRRTIKCCSDDKTHVLPNASSECFPIRFGPDESFLGSCMEFVRSMPIKDKHGTVKLPREHMNAVTSFIDASVVYGSTAERLKEVRDNHGTGYLLNVTEDDYLPSSGSADCIRPTKSDYCFLAGDERVNEHPSLTLIHTILVRLHNRIAHILKYMRPFYPDEDIFQRARAIVIAITQKIMYADWLPIVLGEQTMKTYGLAVGPKFKRSKYDSLLDPTIPTSFSTAVFRFGHTLIPRSVPIGGSQRLLRELFFNPSLIKNNIEKMVDSFTIGSDPDARSQMPDTFIVEEVTNHLFESEEGIGKSFDLIALNIQRARDHGLPTYNDFREYCGLHRIKSFDDSALGVSQKALASIYSHPDDIELFSGGILEPMAYGGLVGETFNCLMREVFYKLKYGDRFFYESYGEKGSFNNDELAEIRKVTLAHVLCQTTGIHEIQVNAFFLPGPKNPRVSCEKLLLNGLDVGAFVRHW
ncbi:chorion peroxidase-like [Pomacea canaliculata]|nr:chorion peroxidase-like [Pomacea canaliculata]